MDRLKSDEDVFTLKYFAEIINSLNFKIVWVRDAHSNVSLALIDNVVDTGVKSYIHKAIELSGANAMFYPDEGAMKRYSALADKPFAFGIKKRDWTTGKIKGLDVSGATEMIEGSRVLIVDDICSKGGTFYHSAKRLKELGAAEVYLYVSHCENSILQGEVLTSGLIERVFTTDSILTEKHEKITIAPPTNSSRVNCGVI
jgi:ribose-phosphate pyrophosphokinase